MLCFLTKNKFFSLRSLVFTLGLLFLMFSSVLVAQQTETTPETEQMPVLTTQELTTPTSTPAPQYKTEASVHAQIKTKFIEGDPIFMGPVLLTLILGLALAIERIIYLNMSTTDNKKLLQEVETALNKGGVEAAKDVWPSSCYFLPRFGQSR